MFAKPSFLTLPDGATLAYDEYGDPQGAPVFFFHGWPASRLQAAGFGPAARELGLRIIAPDRPGIGLSTLKPERQLREWPALLTSLAASLDIERFRVMAVSGGGPYAMVSAWALPERVEAAAVVCGAPPLPVDVPPADLRLIYRLLLRLKRSRPNAIRQLFQFARPLATLRPPLWLIAPLVRRVAPEDYAGLLEAETWRGTFDCYRESWRGSGMGVAVDGEIYSEPWGFDPAEIRVPVTIWHGREDRSFSWRLAEQLAACIPDCIVRILEKEGHFSLPVNHGRAILQELMATSRPAPSGV